MSGLASRGLELANRAIAPLDRLAAARGVAAAPVFVVGLPRSGTTLAYALLVQAFDVAYLTRIYSYTYGLPNLTTRLVTGFTRQPAARFESKYGRIPGRFAPAENAVLWNRWLPELADLGHHFPVEWLAEKSVAEAGRMLASMTAIAARPFVFKNVYMTLSIPALLRLVPGAKVIVVRRDQRAVLASILAGRQSQPSNSWWSIRPPFAADAGDDALAQSVFQAVRGELLLDRALAKLPGDSVKVVDYAELCRSPAGFISDIADWVGASLQPRPTPSLPDSFEPSPGPGIPTGIAATVDELIASLAASADDYAARIEERVRTRDAR